MSRIHLCPTPHLCGARTHIEGSEAAKRCQAASRNRTLRAANTAARVAAASTIAAPASTIAAPAFDTSDIVVDTDHRYTRTDSSTGVSRWSTKGWPEGARASDGTIITELETRDGQITSVVFTEPPDALYARWSRRVTYRDAGAHTDTRWNDLGELDDAPDGTPAYQSVASNGDTTTRRYSNGRLFAVDPEPEEVVRDIDGNVKYAAWYLGGDPACQWVDDGTPDGRWLNADTAPAVGLSTATRPGIPPDR
jgi:hypothetical protein